MGREFEICHLGIRHLHTGRIASVIDGALHLQTGAGGGRADQLNDRLVTDQRFATPVLGDEGEQTMFDTVPFAGARRQMRNRDGQTGLIGQRLQLPSSTDVPAHHCCRRNRR